MDMVSAFARAAYRLDRDDLDAGALYLASMAFHAGGGAGMAYGAYASLRAAQLARIATAGVVRLTLLPAMGVSALAGFGLIVSGIGLFLWIAGVAVGIIAAILEDDECELFLRRTYFGVGGGDNRLGKFKSLQEEIEGLGTLAHGVKVELEWNDELIGADELTVRISVVDWNAADRGFSITVEGFKSAKTKELIAVIADGDVVLPEKPGRDGVHVLELKYPIPSGDIEAIRCTFSLFDTTHAVRTTPDQRWSAVAGVRTLAKEPVWIEDFIF